MAGFKGRSPLSFDKLRSIARFRPSPAQRLGASRQYGRIAMQTLPELLRSQARHFRHKTFLICEDRTWTYGEYFSQVEKPAQVLVDHGGSPAHHRPQEGCDHFRRFQHLSDRGGGCLVQAGRHLSVRADRRSGRGQGRVGRRLCRPCGRQVADRRGTYCRANLAASKAPRRVVFKDALPLGPTGKILKKELRAMIARSRPGHEASRVAKRRRRRDEVKRH